MRAEPGGEGRRRAVGQHIPRAVPLQIDEDRPEHFPPAVAPAVHAEDARRRRGREVRPPDRVDAGVVADDRAEIGEEPRAGPPAERAG
jgi:hypothetical protein